MATENGSKTKKNWKYYLGVTLFVYCWIPYIVSGLLLLYRVPLGKLLGIMAIFIASSEISFAISIALLGKTVVKALEAKIKGVFFRKKVAQPAKPVGKTRYYIGITLLFLSFLPCFLVEILLFFGYPKTDEGHTYMFIGMLIGYTVFVVSLFVVGGDFWDRFKKLFQWQGQSSAK
ncbi:MAG: hypothetical protein K8T10_11025 [Candidatus Eremiobacteraeota bacterium]|nr:hypothetical protein [Candidatus Eremiobacteraeota bacterium]